MLRNHPLKPNFFLFAGLIQILIMDCRWERWQISNFYLELGLHCNFHLILNKLYWSLLHVRAKLSVIHEYFFESKYHNENSARAWTSFCQIRFLQEALSHEYKFLKLCQFRLWIIIFFETFYGCCKVTIQYSNIFKVADIMHVFL